MEEPKPHRIIGFLVSLPIVLILLFAGLVGYYSAACSSISEGIGWAVLITVAIPDIFPFTLVAWALIAFIFSYFLEPARTARRLLLVSLASLAAAPLLCAFAWVAAWMKGSHGSCLIGF